MVATSRPTRATIRVGPARPEGCMCTWQQAVHAHHPKLPVAGVVTKTHPNCPRAPHAPMWVSGRNLTHVTTTSS